jgi:hypothetical protein
MIADGALVTVGFPPLSAHVMDCTPDPASVAWSVTLAGALPITPDGPGVGATLAVVDGGVRSMSTGPNVVEASLPARSEAEPVAL